MKARFTPGPWVFDGQNAGMTYSAGYGLLNESGESIGIHVDCSHGFVNKHGEGVSEANANLIAAAPDMYEALRAGIEVLTALYGQRKDGPGKQAFEKMRKALSKARGETVEAA